MGNQYNVYEALRVLQEHYITSSIQMVARWIREGKLLGSRTDNRKDGYLIDEDDLYRFIEERKPGMILHVENEKEKVENTSLPEKTHSKMIHPPKDKLTERLENQEKSIQLIMEKLDNLSNQNTSIPPIAPQNIELEVRMNQQEKNMQSLSEQFEFLKTNLSEIAENKQESNDKLDELIKRFDKVQNSPTKNTKKMAYVINQPKKIKPTDEGSKEDDSDTWTLKEFKNYAEQFVPEEYRADKEKMNKELKRYFEALFSDNKVKRRDDNRIECPFTKKAYQSMRTLLKKLIPTYFKNHTADISIPPTNPDTNASDNGSEQLQAKLADVSSHKKEDR